MDFGEPGRRLGEIETPWFGDQDNVRLSYALNGALDNPVIESYFGRFKTEGQNLFLAADDLDDLERVVAGRVDYYNICRRHSSLECQIPPAALRQMHLD